MKRKMLFLFLCVLGVEVHAQNMTVDLLIQTIKSEADTIKVENNTIEFEFNDALLICIHDENANRMRIIAPIVRKEQLDEEEILNALVANFHSVLDVKYALSDEILWSVFAHPLQQLSEAQVVDAIQQVYAAAITFGGSYSSTNLVFPGNTKKVEKPKPKSLKKT
ncbi:MAG: hypothetical protein AAGL29_01555 [Bacteroidota bacterium]